jgi:hypothetical protein
MAGCLRGDSGPIGAGEPRLMRESAYFRTHSSLYFPENMFYECRPKRMNTRSESDAGTDAPMC